MSTGYILMLIAAAFATVIAICVMVLPLLKPAPIGVGGDASGIEDELSAATKIAITLDGPGHCPKEQPLAVVVTNRSSLYLKRVDFRFTVYEPGRSTNFAEPDIRMWDIVVAPGKTEVACAAKPTLIPHAPAKHLTIQVVPGVPFFYSPGEYIPLAHESDAGDR